MPAVTTKLQPRKFIRTSKCTSGCSLSPHRLPGEMADVIHGWFEAGHNNNKIIELAAKLGTKISNGAVGRHRSGHLEPVRSDEGASPDPTNLRLNKVNHVEYLEQIVARANLGASSARITPEMGIKAIELINRLNAGSQMSEFMQAVSDAMAGGGIGEDDEYLTPIEAAEAKRDAEEAAQGEAVVE